MISGFRPKLTILAKVYTCHKCWCSYFTGYSQQNIFFSLVLLEMYVEEHQVTKCHLRRQQLVRCRLSIMGTVIGFQFALNRWIQQYVFQRWIDFDCLSMLDNWNCRSYSHHFRKTSARGNNHFWRLKTVHTDFFLCVYLSTWALWRPWSIFRNSLLNPPSTQVLKEKTSTLIRFFQVQTYEKGEKKARKRLMWIKFGYYKSSRVARADSVSSNSGIVFSIVNTERLLFQVSNYDTKLENSLRFFCFRL